VKELRSVGLNPDVILCRSASPLLLGTREKLALFCQDVQQPAQPVSFVPSAWRKVLTWATSTRFPSLTQVR
jgi:CTP synthase